MVTTGKNYSVAFTSVTLHDFFRFYPQNKKEKNHLLQHNKQNHREILSIAFT